MCADKPKVNPTSRYSINETCALLGIHRNSLTHYTEAQMIRCIVRPNGRRYYTGSEITRFWNKTI